MSQNNKNNPGQPSLKARPADIALAVIPALFALGVKTVAGPCIHEDGTTGMCATAGTVLFAFGIVALVLALLRLLAADKRTRRGFDLFLFLVGIIIAVSPGTVLQLCMMATMHCRAVMLPFARIMGAALSLAALACEFTVDREASTSRKVRR